jgi:hypothetical protein
VSIYRQVRAADPSQESVQLAVQHVTGAASWNHGDVAGADSLTTKAGCLPANDEWQTTVSVEWEWAWAFK